MAYTVMMTMHNVTCWCGQPFAVNEDLHRQFRDCGKTIYCPVGHTVVVAETEAQKLKRELDRVNQRIAQRDDEIRDKERELIAAKGQITKLRKRASAGSCPCCKRTFSNMAAHMKTKHPDFKAEPPALKVVA